MQLVQHKLGVGFDGVHATGQEEYMMQYESNLENKMASGMRDRILLVEVIVHAVDIVFVDNTPCAIP